MGRERCENEGGPAHLKMFVCGDVLELQTILLWNRASQVPGWPRTWKVIQNDLTLVILFLLLPSARLTYAPLPMFVQCWASNPEFWGARQVLYQLICEKVSWFGHTKFIPQFLRIQRGKEILNMPLKTEIPKTEVEASLSSLCPVLENETSPCAPSEWVPGLAWNSKFLRNVPGK